MEFYCRDGEIRDIGIHQLIFDLNLINQFTQASTQDDTEFWSKISNFSTDKLRSLIYAMINTYKKTKYLKLNLIFLYAQIKYSCLVM